MVYWRYVTFQRHRHSVSVIVTVLVSDWPTNWLQMHLKIVLLQVQFSVLILPVQVDTGVLIPLWVAPPPWPSGGPSPLPCFLGPPSPLPFSRVLGPTPRQPRPLRDPSPPLARVHRGPTLPASRRLSTLQPPLLKPSSAAPSWRRTVRNRTGCPRRSFRITSSSARCRKACSSKTTAVTASSSSSSSSKEGSTTSSTAQAVRATEAPATQTARIWISTTFQSLWAVRAGAPGRMIITTLVSARGWPTPPTGSPTGSTSPTTPPCSRTGPTQLTRTPMPFFRTSSPQPGWVGLWEAPQRSPQGAEAGWTTASQEAARTTSGWTGASGSGSMRTTRATRRATDWDQSRGARRRRAWARGQSTACRRPRACRRTSGGTEMVLGSIGFWLRTDQVAKTEQEKVNLRSLQKDEVLYDTHCVTHCVTHTHTFERSVTQDVNIVYEKPNECL